MSEIPQIDDQYYVYNNTDEYNTIKPLTVIFNSLKPTYNKNNFIKKSEKRKEKLES